MFEELDLFIGEMIGMFSPMKAGIPSKAHTCSGCPLPTNGGTGCDPSLVSGCGGDPDTQDVTCNSQ